MVSRRPSRPSRASTGPTPTGWLFAAFPAARQSPISPGGCRASGREARTRACPGTALTHAVLLESTPAPLFTPPRINRYQGPVVDIPVHEQPYHCCGNSNHNASGGLLPPFRPIWHVHGHGRGGQARIQGCGDAVAQFSIRLILVA